MKRVGIHQINYFPWSGYFNKMAKSDIFIFLDEVQLSYGSYSQRTPVMSNLGQQSFLNIGVIKKGHMEKTFREILLNPESVWREKHYNFLKGSYASCPYYKEVMDAIEPVFDTNFKTLFEVTLCGINIIRDALEIHTPTVMQSSLCYDKEAKKSSLVLELTKAVDGDTYLSGSGARQYMDLQEFADQDINVEYQRFKQFEYSQRKGDSFVAGLSVLDMLFNIGISNSKELFWENIQDEEEIEQVLSERIEE